jgi:hypothetical protein
MTDALKAIAIATALPLLAGGCTLAAGATAGAVAGSEIEEEDGEFDPLENTEIGEEVYGD